MLSVSEDTAWSSTSSGVDTFARLPLACFWEVPRPFFLGIPSSVDPSELLRCCRFSAAFFLAAFLCIASFRRVGMGKGGKGCGGSGTIL
jgi:hypothetical protein